MSARAARAVLALALALSPASCGRRGVVAPPRAPDVPGVLLTQPPPRTVGYPVDGEIWALFDRALDPHTVDSTTVFLKQDTRRISSAIVYETLTHRIQIRPRSALVLRTTYTVEISPQVRAQAGDEIGTMITWQFTTSSLSRIRLDRPAEGALEGPHALLAWSGNAASPEIVYEVYAGPDSFSVSQRTAPRLGVVSNSWLLPRATWPAGARVYWSVTAVHQTFGERLNGPVSSFDVYAASSPVDSVSILLSEWGGVRSGNSSQLCNQPSITIAPNYNSAIKFPVDGNHPDWRVAEAYVTAYTANDSAYIGAVEMDYASTPWASCSIAINGPPSAAPDGALARGAPFATRGNMMFRTDALAAFVEVAGRYGGWYGFMLRGMQSGSMVMNVGSVAVPRPTLVVKYYRPVAAAADDKRP